MSDDPVLQAIEALREDVRKVGRAVVAGRPEPRPEARADARGPTEDDRWALALLPAVDSLARCARAARVLASDLGRPRRRLWLGIPADPRGDSVAEGVELALASLEDALAARGYRLDRAAGVPFDATRHTAVATEPLAPGGPVAGTVVRTERAGLWQGERLLREAGVVVTSQVEAR